MCHTAVDIGWIFEECELDEYVRRVKEIILCEESEQCHMEVDI